MPTRIVWALCVLAAFFCVPHPAAAQSNQASGGEAILKRLSLLPAPAKLLPNNAASVSTLPTVPTARQTSVLRELRSRSGWFSLLLKSPQQTPNNLEIQPLFAASTCAHMIIAVAPHVDSQMVIVAPGRSADNMPAVRGLPPCPEDVRPAQVPFTDPGISSPPKR